MFESMLDAYHMTEAGGAECEIICNKGSKM
jgi:hypothetical protein